MQAKQKRRQSDMHELYVLGTKELGYLLRSEGERLRESEKLSQGSGVRNRWEDLVRGRAAPRLCMQEEKFLRRSGSYAEMHEKNGKPLGKCV